MDVEDRIQGPLGIARRRGLLAAGAVALAVAACALVGAGLAPAQALAKKPPRLIHNNSPIKVTCVPGPAGTVRARISTRMTVVNYHGWADWADHMEAKVRLEPTTAGLNYTRVWGTSKSPYLTQDKRHAYNMTPLSDNLSGTADWQAHVKLIWHRPAPIKNVTKDLYLAFDGSCANTGGGPGLPTGRNG